MEKDIPNTPETKAIRQRMEEARCDLDEDVQEIVEGARDMGEWRTYVRTYPWLCLGAALTAGYWFVPRRRFGPADAQTIAELASSSRLQLPWKGHARDILLAFVGNLLMRGVSVYIGQHGGKTLATQTAKAQQDEQP